MAAPRLADGSRFVETRLLRASNSPGKPVPELAVGGEVPQGETWLVERAYANTLSGVDTAGGFLFVTGDRATGAHPVTEARDMCPLDTFVALVLAFGSAIREYSQPIVMQGGQRLEVIAYCAGAQRCTVGAQVSIYRDA